MTRLTVREAMQSDVDAVLALEQACAEAPHWERDTYSAMVRIEPGLLVQRVLFIGESAGEIAGFAVVSIVDDRAELESVAVAPPARRKGTGRALCEALMQWAGSNGARELVLEVRSTNHAAQAMYAQLGFVQVGTRKAYYSHPMEDAIVMAFHL